jgi:hypothetical protein
MLQKASQLKRGFPHDFGAHCTYCAASSVTGPYHARALAWVLSVSVIRATPTSAPGGSPNAASKSERILRLYDNHIFKFYGPDSTTILRIRLVRGLTITVSGFRLFDHTYMRVA